MHRQSLGSPPAKLHINGVITIKESSSSPLSLSSSSSSSPATITTSSELVQKELPSNNHNDEEDDEKFAKKSHKTSPSKHPERFIHIIPVLTLFCILVLYLSSHVPSQNELAQFNGFKAFSNFRDSINNVEEEIQGLSEIGKGNILAIRSARNLQGLERGNPNSKFRLNRKIGDF